MKFKGRKFNFAVVSVNLPNGMRVNIDLIEHPGAVLIVPFINRREVIFLRQYRPAIGKYLLELPAGTLDKGERPLCCARRELMEETDYRAARFKKLGKIHPVPGYSTEVIHIYKAEGLTRKPGIKDPDEVIYPQVLRKPEVRDHFKRGRFTDAKTIAALTMVGWL